MEYLETLPRQVSTVKGLSTIVVIDTAVLARVKAAANMAVPRASVRQRELQGSGSSTDAIPDQKSGENRAISSLKLGQKDVLPSGEMNFAATNAPLALVKGWFR